MNRRTGEENKGGWMRMERIRNWAEGREMRENFESDSLGELSWGRHVYFQSQMDTRLKKERGAGMREGAIFAALAPIASAGVRSDCVGFGHPMTETSRAESLECLVKSRWFALVESSSRLERKMTKN